MMKPDLEEKNHAKYGISVLDEKNKKEKAQERPVGGDGNAEDVENYETSPESPVFYEEILNKDELQKLKKEFSRLEKSCYLDHAGATLYGECQIDSHLTELKSVLYSNPHSRNPSSTITTDAIDYVRHKILAHFGTTSDDYSVIFTSGTTAALKLVAESFQFNEGLFAYLEESHTSVVGMREIAHPNLSGDSNDIVGQAKVYSLSKFSLEKLMDPEFYCGVGCCCLNCQIQCEEARGASCWNHHHREQKTDHVNSFSPTKTDCPDSMEASLIIGDTPAAKTKSKENCHRKDAFEKNALFVYPAQCNFSGFKYSLEWISQLQNGRLDCISGFESFFIEDLGGVNKSTSFSAGGSFNGNDSNEDGQHQTCHASETITHKENTHKWYVMLDAASYVATNPLNLSDHPADFIGVSFYKMFGFPTGLGALIVRNESAHVLKKQYFGGGTVNIAVPSRAFHVKRSNLFERFEDGTIPFLSILAVRDGLDSLTKLCRSMDFIRERTFRLAQYFYRNLSNMSYGNGQRVAKIYADTEFTSPKTQGPIVTFNLLRSDGAIIGYSEMEQIAYLHDVHLRYGCFCNPGACRRHLNLLPDEVIKQYEAGHVCGDMNDLIDGKPTGAIRISIGYMTNADNLDFLLRLIHRCWIQPENFRERNENFPVSQPDILSVESTVGTRNSFKERKLLRIFVYPIKSCAAFEVPKTWAIGPRGLLYDREWLIVNSAGVPLTLKREPRLCQLKPKIDISNRKLVLSNEGFPDVSTPLEISQLQRAPNNNALKAELCTSKVCGDTVMGLDCGPEVNNWLADVFGTPGLKLLRMSPDHQRKPKNALDEISLANHSQFLLLSLGSLRRLARQLMEKRVVSYLIPSWEETLACEGRQKADRYHQNGEVKAEDQESALERKVVNNLIERFRGNFVVGHSIFEENNSPFDEEEWKETSIGDLMFKSGGPCMRCATICTDQQTGVRGPEPLLTLSAMRSGRANFGIHLYHIGSITGADNNSAPGPCRRTTSSLLSSPASLPLEVNKQSHHEQSIPPSRQEKVHFRTIKAGSGKSSGRGDGNSSQDEPLQENGIATVPSGRYSAEENKTPLEKRHEQDDDRAYSVAPAPILVERELGRRGEPMMIMTDETGTSSTTATTPPKNVENSGIKLKNQQLSSNSSSQPFTLSKSSSAKLPNSSLSIASQVQAIHIGDLVSELRKQEAVEAATISTTPSSSSSMTQIHTTSSLDSTSITNGQQLHRSKISLFNNNTDATAPVQKCNSSFGPSGSVKSPIFRQTLQVSTTSLVDREGNTGNFTEMLSLIGSID